MIAMANQDILFDWWWSQNGPREGGHLTIREIATRLDKARQAKIVHGKTGGPITEAGWNYAVLTFLTKYCTTSSEVERELVGLALPSGNRAGWKKFRDRSAVINELSTADPTVGPLVPPEEHKPSVVGLGGKPPDGNDRVLLRHLIADLQSAMKNEGIEYRTLKKALADLSRLGYQYDHALFPDLENTENYTDSIGESPSSLAEALLWKLGKWKSYKKFTTYYRDDSLTPTQTDVVFYAFARHLKDRSNPIYDQHAIRALWAICGNLSNAEKSNCKSLLFDRHDRWKQVGSGSVTIECYDIYVRHVRTLMIGSHVPSLTELDRLLMPLGQAIKGTTSTYADFQRLCGWPIKG
jgi:hypothetical protein